MAEDEKEVVKTAERLAEVDTPTPKEESPQPKETETAEKPVETPAEPEAEEEALPQDAKEAGKAFQEMRKRTKELEAKLKELETKAAPVAEEREPVANPFFENQPTYVGNNQPDVNQFIDPNTGEFDAVSYTRFVNDNATRAAAETARQQVEEYRQTQEAYSSYPELNPEAKEFDTDFYRATRGLLLDSMVRPNEYNGKTLTLKQAADQVLGLSAKARKQVAEEATNRAMQEVASKEATSLEAGGNSGRVASAESDAQYEFLKEASKGGSPESTRARAERLDKLGI